MKNKKINIAIASGKGGTGKTLIATNLFYSLMQKGVNINLVDCDAEQPNSMIFFESKLLKSNIVSHKVPVIDETICDFCGKCYEYCNFNAIFCIPSANIIKVMNDLCHSCGACSYACKIKAIKEKKIKIGKVNKYYIKDNCIIIESKMETGVYTSVPAIKQGIKESALYDFVIFDSPPGTSCPFIHTVINADFVILVTEPTPFGLSDLIQSINTLKILKKHYGVIINRCDIGDNKVYEYLNTENIPLFMEIPYNKQIAIDYSRGELVFKNNYNIQNEFIELFEMILIKYGNSSNQR